MVLTIAIICILAAVLIMSVGTYISNAKARSIEADSSRRSVLVNIASSEAEMNTLGFGNTTGSNVHNVTRSSAASPVAGS
jgi:Tfp pilus assembly major pilin PilA